MPTNRYLLQITNPHHWSTSGLIHVQLPPLPSTHYSVSSFQLYNEEGQEITSQIIPLEKGGYELKFVIEDIPAAGKKKYYFQEQDRSADFLPPQEGLMDGNDYYLENDCLRVIIEENGTFTIMHKQEAPENEQTDTILIMGEELGAGSIWAGEEFYNFFGLVQIGITDQILHPKTIISNLIEASDFIGKLHVEYDFQTPDQFLASPSTEVSIFKGDYPVIQFETTLPSSPSLFDKEISLLFPLGTSNPQIVLQPDYLLVMNATMQTGLVFMGKNVIFQKISLPQENLDYIQAHLTINNPNIHKSPKKFEYAIIPVSIESEDSLSDLKSKIQRYRKEYLYPLSCQITIIEN